MKKVFWMAAAALVLAACGGNATKKGASVAEAPDMHTAATSLDYEGTYTGTFPAADCPGIATTLTLRPDGTYDEHSRYLDRDTEFDRKGAYTVQGNLLMLTPADGDSIVWYKVEENRLRRLDADKQPVEGPLAENYSLTKTD